MSDGRAKVVIIGAGFGGLAAAKALERTPVDVTVIDRQNHHCFQPLLYQVATAALSPADIAWPIRHILRKQQNADGADGRGRAASTPASELVHDRSGDDPLRLSGARDRRDPFLFRSRRMGRRARRA